MADRPFTGPGNGRLALVMLAALSLAVGIWAGLVRLGFALGTPAMLATGLLQHHAALMVSGFLGTLIGVERAVAHGGRWPWAGPAVSGLGAAALIAGLPASLGLAAMVAAALVMTAVMMQLCLRQPGIATGVMGLAPIGWVAGNVMLLTGATPARVLPWWAAFLILTIAGERLILSRLMRPSPAAQWLFLVACAVVLTAPLLDSWSAGAGARLAAAGWLLLAAWLLRFDVARRRARAGGLPRFVAVALVTGYAWLGLAGLLVLSQGLDPLARHLVLPGVGSVAGFALPYDATVHALLLGFVFSMIFAHAPIVLPAVLGRQVAWRSRFWAHLALLHASVLARVAADIGGDVALRSWAGAGNALAILVFGVSTALAVAGPAADAVRTSPRATSQAEPRTGRADARTGSRRPAIARVGTATVPSRRAGRG